MFCCNLLETENDKILAIADSEIIGKTFSEGKIQLIVDKNFYGEETNSPEYLINKATIINAVGHKSVNLLVEKNIIKKENVIHVQGIPHAQAVSML